VCKQAGTAQQLCDLERVKPQPPPSLLLGLEPVQSYLGVARVMTEQNVTNYSVPVIFELPCINTLDNNQENYMKFSSSLIESNISTVPPKQLTGTPFAVASKRIDIIVVAVVNSSV